jgi:hypothetical protein
MWLRCSSFPPVPSPTNARSLLTHSSSPSLSYSSPLELRQSSAPLPCSLDLVLDTRRSQSPNRTMYYKPAINFPHLQSSVYFLFASFHSVPLAEVGPLHSVDLFYFLCIRSFLYEDELVSFKSSPPQTPPLRHIHRNKEVLYCYGLYACGRW